MEFDALFPKFWKGRQLKWCYLCDCAIILCTDCNNSSCNGGGCEKCHEDFLEFSTCKHSIRDYLTKEEKETSEKIHQLKKHILQSLESGEKEIDFKKLKETGALSQNEEQLYFKDFLLQNN